MNTVEIRLVINGKEAITTLQLTDENVQKMADHLNQLGAKGAASMELIRQRYSTLVALMENVPLGSKEFEELSVMVGSAKKEMDAAEAMMRKTTGSTGAARSAVTSLSQTLSDSTQFQNGFRFGMMAIGNNLDQLFTQLAMVKQQSAETGQSMSKQLVSALSGPGGVMIGLTAVITLLQILPGLLDKSDNKLEEFSLEALGGTKKLSDYSTALSNVEKELRTLNAIQIEEKIIEIQARVTWSKEKVAEVEREFESNLKSFGIRLAPLVNLIMGVDVPEARKQLQLIERTEEVAKEALANRSRVKILEDEIAALREAQNKKGTDLRENLAQIEAKERERADLLKTNTQRREEAAAITIQLQRAQVEAMEDGYNKQRAAANAAFDEAKAGLDKELQEKKISQFQYTELLKLEEKKRQNDFASIESAKNTAAVDLRADALRRMADIDAAETNSKIAIDEKIAQSKAKTEAERLQVTRDFAIKRVEAEANAQAQILLIERQALEEKYQTAVGKEKEDFSGKLTANSAALSAVGTKADLAKKEILIGFKVDSESLPAIESIAGMEARLANDQQELSKATSDQQREDIRRRVEDHKAALLKMSYSEEQFAKDLYSGLKDLYGQISQLISQNIQEDADAKLAQLDVTYRVRDEQIAADKEAALERLQAEQDSVVSAAVSSDQRTKLNKTYSDRRKAIEKDSAETSKRLEAEKEARAKQIKIEAFETQKKLSYVTAVINIAEAITRIMATIPPPFNIPLIALSAATGAIQLATIAGSKPALKDGGIFAGDGPVRGPGGPTDDAVNAHLSNGEFVVNARMTAKYYELLNAINEGKPIAPRFETGGLYEKLRRAESIRVPIPTAGSSLSAVREVAQLDTSRLEAKIDQVIKAINEQQVIAEIDGQKLVTRIEEIQKVNASRTF